MEISTKYLQNFERGLNPHHPERSVIPAEIVGYGEISSIFKIANHKNWVFKRLPLFNNNSEAKIYAEKHDSYTTFLKQAGISLPQDYTKIIKSKRFVLYLAQEALNKKDLCQNKLHVLSKKETIEMLKNILIEIKKVMDFNQQNSDIALSIDGQVSNWALVNNKLLYFDTSTPLFKIKGKEQMDPELLLNSTPKALRWMIRWFFLQEVMDRYYDIRLVYIDLIANLYKEKKQDLINATLEIANGLLPKSIDKISRKEIDKYYQNDKFIWQLFLSLRKIDRWFTNNILRKQYEFILPRKIER